MTRETRRILRAKVDCRRRHQSLDGFGVNINSKCWNDGALEPVMGTLVDDLGATLFRQDVCGRSDWPDPRNEMSAAKALSDGHLERTYAGVDFRNGMGMGKHLNRRGIEPYMTLSGVVPKWMCAPDGSTLKDFRAFAEMAASFAEWARKEAGIRYTLFGPMNETDIGPPEGPKAGPKEYVRACETLIEALDRRGLKDLKLVVAEQAHFNLDYVRAFLSRPRLCPRIGVFAMHKYGDGRMEAAVSLVRKGPARDARVWMTEFGDLEQGGDREWLTAWVIFRRLMDTISDGYNAALNWDAFDNYHDHDESWSIYGLIRYGLRTWTPKKRFYAMKQAYRFIRPGAILVETEQPDRDVRLQAFMSPDGDHLTVTGMNDSEQGAVIEVTAAGLDEGRFPRRALVCATTVDLDCATLAETQAVPTNWPKGVRMEFTVPPASIFTASTVR
jgi:O-glycosyl hydrolase